jgi:hypothetical protein
VRISVTGEEEVKVVKFVAPVTAGAWCDKEHLRSEAE